MEQAYLFLAYNHKKQLVYVGYYPTLEEAEKWWPTACGYNHSFLVTIQVDEGLNEIAVLKYEDRVSHLTF